MLSQRREAEQEKLTIRDELVRSEQDRLELDSLRLALHQSLQESELARAGLEAELQSLQADRAKLQDRITQVTVSLPLSLSRSICPSMPHKPFLMCCCQSNS